MARTNHLSNVRLRENKYLVASVKSHVFFFRMICCLMSKEAAESIATNMLLPLLKTCFTPEDLETFVTLIASHQIECLWTGKHIIDCLLKIEKVLWHRLEDFEGRDLGGLLQDLLSHQFFCKTLAGQHGLLTSAFGD